MGAHVNVDKMIYIVVRIPAPPAIIWDWDVRWKRESGDIMLS